MYSNPNLLFLLLRKTIPLCIYWRGYILGICMSKLCRIIKVKIKIRVTGDGLNLQEK